MASTSKGNCVEPDIGRLKAAYELGLLTPQDRARFEMHAFVCDACFHELYQFQSYAQAMQAAPARAYPSELAETRRPTSARHGWMPSYSRILAVALLLCLVALPLTLYKIVDLKKEIRGLKESQAAQQAAEKQQVEQMAAEKTLQQAEIADLKAERATHAYANPFFQALEISALRSTDEQEEIRLPREAQLLNLALKLTEKGSFTGYRVELRDPAGAAVAESRALKMDKYHMLQLAIPVNRLASQRYTLTIDGIHTDRAKRIAERVIVVHRE